MNLTGHSERNGKPDVYSQYFRRSLQSNVFAFNFHTFGTSKHLANTRTSGHKEHCAKWPVVKENSASRPSFLRLDSQGECSKNDWVYDSSYAVNTSSRKAGTFSLFTNGLRRYADTGVRYHKPEPAKPYNTSLSIASAVKLLCEKSDFLFPCHRKNQKDVSVANSYDVMTGVYPLQYRSKLVPCCTGITVPCTQPPDLLSSLQLQQHEEQWNLYSQDLQHDFDMPYLSVSSFLPISLSYVVDLPDCGSAFQQCHRMNYVNQLSVVRSSEAVNNSGTPDTRWVRRHIRQPRYNCRRKWLRVCYNTRFRKLPAQYGARDAAATDRIASDCELVHYDIDTNECSDSSQENKLVLNDDKQNLFHYFSSICDLDAVTSCKEKSAMWINHCSSERPLPSSLCDIQEMPLPESCSFASLFFVPGDEIDGSDFCSVDGDESSCSGFLSPTSTFRADDDVLADALLSGLSCIPFTDNWVMDCFGNCAAAGFNSEFGMFFEEDTTSVPRDYDVCEYPLGVREANARWNEAYAFPADVLFQTSQPNTKMLMLELTNLYSRVANQRHGRTDTILKRYRALHKSASHNIYISLNIALDQFCLVQFSSNVSMVTVLNQLEWADAYQQARCGPWEQYARDRERFARRVREIDQQISWVLTAQHRATKYRYLQTCTATTDSSAARLLPS